LLPIGTKTEKASWAGWIRTSPTAPARRSAPACTVSGRPVILARSTDAQPSFRLPPGNYLASVTYGFVSTSKRVP
jgi:hypothetical protein